MTTGEKSAVRLLPLKSDLIFKMVFGDYRYIGITKAFLRAALDIPAGECEELRIIDPHLERDLPSDKLGILDVRLELKSGKLIAVEVQVDPISAMAERVAFSTGRNLARQIAPGEDYSKIEKVVTIVIANYNMIEADRFYRHIFRLYDAERSVLFTDVMEIHTLELKKLPEEKSAGSDSREEELLNWLRLIRSEKEEEIEMLATKTPEMEAAVGRLKQLSADERTQMLYEARQLFLMDEQVRRADARAEGRAEGKAEGRAEGKAEVARNMFAMGWDAEKIAQATNLPVSDIQKLISSLTEK